MQTFVKKMITIIAPSTRLNLIDVFTTIHPASSQSQPSHKTVHEFFSAFFPFCISPLQHHSQNTLNYAQALQATHTKSVDDIAAI